MMSTVPCQARADLLGHFSCWLLLTFCAFLSVRVNVGSTGKVKKELKPKGGPTSVILQEGGQEALRRNLLPCVPSWPCTGDQSPFRSAACVSGNLTHISLDFFLRLTGLKAGTTQRPPRYKLLVTTQLTISGKPEEQISLPPPAIREGPMDSL